MDIILFCRQILQFTAYLNSFVKKNSLARVDNIYVLGIYTFCKYISCGFHIYISENMQTD